MDLVVVVVAVAFDMKFFWAKNMTRIRNWIQMGVCVYPTLYVLKREKKTEDGKMVYALVLGVQWKKGAKKPYASLFEMRKK